jgi:VanZ family protein
VFFTIALYAALDELTQSLIASRQADLLDWLADLVGTSVGITAFATVRTFFA